MLKHKIADLQWGIRWGLIFAGVFWALALAVELARIASSQLKDPYDLSLPGVLLYELLAGVLGGVALGAFRKHTATMSGAILLGWLIVSLAAMVGGLVLPQEFGTGGDWLSIILISVATGLVIGPAIGYTYFKMFHRDDDPDV